VTPHGGATEYFGGEAWYVDPASVDSIRHGIEQAIDTAPGDHLKQHLLTEYSWKNIARQTAEAYRETLERAPEQE
jgi:glycosyltransferase involved in cell wall biosynthesis